MNLGKQIDSVDYRNNVLISINNMEQQINAPKYDYVHGWGPWADLDWFVDIFHSDFRVWI